MQLPDNFQPSEQFQDAVRRAYNRYVREWFRDLDIDSLSLNLSIQRHAALAACTHYDNDSLLLTVGKMMYFNEIRQRASVGVDSGIGETSESYDVIRRGHPKVLLFFMEDSQDVEFGYKPIRGEITFRLMDETTTSIAQTRVNAIANKIRSEFAVGSGYVWRKGRTMFTYNDWGLGYGLKVLCRNETEGREIVSKVLDIQNHTPDWSKAKVNENQEPSTAYPPVPPSERILGENRRLPRRRPVADVRFKYAALFVQGLQYPIPLVDLTGTFSNPVAS